MDSEQNEETSDTSEQRAPEPPQEPPRSRLRDLRPEKDPMGAGGNGLPKP